jgi:hypothetical protein
MNLQKTGRMIGGLILLQFFVGILNMQVLTAPLFQDGGYLIHAGPNEVRLGWSVLLALVGGLLTIGIASLAYPVLRACSETTGLLYVLLCAVGATLTGVEQVGILSMRDFSSSYLAADPASQSVLETMSVAGSALRNGVHYVGLLIFGVTIGVWYLCLLHFALLPRVIPVLGLAAVCLQLYSISQPVLGGEVSFPLLAPMGLTMLLQGGWLLAFGFRRAPVQASPSD